MNFVVVTGHSFIPILNAWEMVLQFLLMWYVGLLTIYMTVVWYNLLIYCKFSPIVICVLIIYGYRWTTLLLPLPVSYFSSALRRTNPFSTNLQNNKLHTSISYDMQLRRWLHQRMVHFLKLFLLCFKHLLDCDIEIFVILVYTFSLDRCATSNCIGNLFAFHDQNEYAN